jgi:hypothetical protein
VPAPGQLGPELADPSLADASQPGRDSSFVPDAEQLNHLPHPGRKRVQPGLEVNSERRLVGRRAAPCLASALYICTSAPSIGVPAFASTLSVLGPGFFIATLNGTIEPSFLNRWAT